jgi:predicted nucleic acid-binding protein
LARYLLDTDAVIDWIKGFAPTVGLIGRLLRDNNDLCTSPIVVAEVETGLLPHEDQRARDLLDSCLYLECPLEAARLAGQWRKAFTPARQVRPVADFLIAATALAHDAVVITGNVRHFPMQEVRLLPLPRAP